MLIFISLMLMAYPVFAQYKITLQLNNAPPHHRQDTIYVAGSFNQWNPALAKSMFVKDSNNVLSLEIENVPAGDTEFKFTRGSWAKVETKMDGVDTGNRKLIIMSDTLIQVSIAGWKDDFISIPKRHTASSNVRILDTAFAIPQLGRARRTWIYLPPGYKKSRKRYPVIYMQDGQNIFDEFTAAFEEWGVDETVDSITKKGKPASIIVGIDNGPRRMNEYNPYEFKDFGKGEGDEYVDFLAKTLKPYIDRKYRTLPSRLTTVVAGSSMGGLISYYAMLKYPEIFGKGGIFSPAFWPSPQIKELTDSIGHNLNGKIFFYMGGQEGEQYIEDMKTVTDTLGNKSAVLMYIVTDPLATHNEKAWRKWFPEFYNWILAPGFNYVIGVED